MYIATLLALLFLLSSAILAGMTTALLQMGRLRSKEEFKKIPSLFFFQHVLKPLFGRQKWEGLFFTLSFSKHVLHLCYSVILLFLLFSQNLSIWLIGGAVILLSLAADLLMKFIATAAPTLSFKFFAPLASLFLLLFSPLTALLLRMSQAFFPKDRKSTRLNSSHNVPSRMPSSA